jgi:hypothetical protein
LFVFGLREALIQIGFTKDEAAKYLFHGWRHFFTSYMIKKLNKKLLKTQTGHLTDEMLDLYGDHETEGDKELIQATEREAFAGLLPALTTSPQGEVSSTRSKMLILKKENPPIAACQ